MSESVSGQSPEGRHCLRTTSPALRTPTAQQVVHFGPLSLNGAVAVHHSAVPRDARNLQPRSRRERLGPHAIRRTGRHLCRSASRRTPTALAVVDGAPVPVAVAGACAIASVSRRARNRHREAAGSRRPSLVRRAPDAVYVSGLPSFPTAVLDHLAPRAVQRARSPNVAEEIVAAGLERDHASNRLRPVAIRRAESLD